MIRTKTINKTISFLKDVLNSGCSINKYCKDNNFHAVDWYNRIRKCKGNQEVDDLLLKIQGRQKDVDNTHTSDLGFDNIAADTEYVRNEEGIIVGYKFNIKRKVGGPLIGTLSRTQMDRLCSLYSRYGADLTAAQTSLDFPDYSLDELNRIKHAFLIYKYSCPFAPHTVDEHTTDELHNLAIERKKNNLTKTLEKNQLADFKKINLQLTKEINELKDWKKELSGINIKLSGVHPNSDKPQNPTENILMLNLSDIHVGAALSSTSLYDNTWNEATLTNRLYGLINKIDELNNLVNGGKGFCKIYLNLLGDMLDGMDNMTARRDHVMPQNMDNKEQFRVFLDVMCNFINELQTYSKIINITSVPNGNHTGAPEYFAVTALQYSVNNNMDGVDMRVFDKYIGHYTLNGHCFVIMHGKDADFMKKPMPLHLNDATTNWINNYLDREGLTAKYYGKIHILKGDLHTAAFDDNLKFNYRNCLSLFGDSDYSQMNYLSNGYGCSYSLINGDTIINGEFKNF